MNWIRMDQWWMRSDPPGYNISVGHVGPFEVSYLAYAGAGASAVLIASRHRIQDEPGPRRAAAREIREAVEAYAADIEMRDAEKRAEKERNRRNRHA